jgi:hypothetical protein
MFSAIFACRAFTLAVFVRETFQATNSTKSTQPNQLNQINQINQIDLPNQPTEPNQPTRLNQPINLPKWVVFLNITAPQYLTSQIFIFSKHIHPFLNIHAPSPPPHPPPTSPQTGGPKEMPYILADQ